MKSAVVTASVNHERMHRGEAHVVRRRLSGAAAGRPPRRDICCRRSGRGGWENRSVPMYRDEAVVLRTHKLGEADRIVTMLTPAARQGPRRRQGRAAHGVAVRRAARAVHGRRRAALQGPHPRHRARRPRRSARTAPTSSRDYARYTAANAMVETADRLTEARGGRCSSTCCSSARCGRSRAASTRRASCSTRTCCARSRSRAGRRASPTARAAARPGRTRRSSCSSAAWSADDVRPAGHAALDAATARAARRAARRATGTRRRRRRSATATRRAASSPPTPSATSSAGCARSSTSSERPHVSPQARTRTATRWPSARRLDRRSTRPSCPKGAVPEHVAIVMDGNGRWANRRGPDPHRGAQGGRGGAARRRRRRHPGRREAPLGVRVLDRELEALARRGALPDGLQPRRAAPPPRPAQRVGRAGALGRAQAAAVGARSSTSCSSPSSSPRGNDTLTLTMCVNYGGRAELADAVRDDRRRRRRRAAEALGASPRRPSRSTSTSPTCPTSTCSCAARASSAPRTSCSGSRRTPRWCSSTRCGPTSRAPTCGARSSSTPTATAASAARSTRPSRALSFGDAVREYRADAPFAFIVTTPSRSTCGPTSPAPGATSASAISRRGSPRHPP